MRPESLGPGGVAHPREIATGCAKGIGRWLDGGGTAYYGEDAIPQAWREKLARRPSIESLADQISRFRDSKSGTPCHRTARIGKQIWRPLPSKDCSRRGSDPGVNCSRLAFSGWPCR